MQKDMLAVFHHVKDRMAVHPRLIVLERQLSFLASMLGAAVLPCLPRFAPPRFAVTLEDVVALRLQLLVEDGHLVGELRLALLILTSYLVASLGEVAHLDVVHLLVLLKGGTTLAEIVGRLTLVVDDGIYRVVVSRVQGLVRSSFCFWVFSSNRRWNSSVVMLSTVETCASMFLFSDETLLSFIVLFV